MLEILPGVDWMWTVGLAAVGILTIAVGGLNKLTIVTGPFLVIASVCSLLRQTNRLSVNHEIPILVIVLGVLMAISQLSRLTTPDVAPCPAYHTRFNHFSRLQCLNDSDGIFRDQENPDGSIRVSLMAPKSRIWHYDSLNKL